MLLAARHVKGEWIERYKHLASDSVVAIGGGSLIDQAKRVAVQANLPLVVVPTGLATDAMFTGASVRRPLPGVVEYDKTKKPDVVVYDKEILEAAPEKFQTLGWCEVFSILTASYRWRRNKQAVGRWEEDDELIYQEAQALVCISRKGLKCLFEALRKSVGLCERAGTDDVEEGVEHFLAYRLEPYASGFLHAELLFFTIPMILEGYGVACGSVLDELRSKLYFDIVEISSELERKAHEILDSEFKNEFGFTIAEEK